MYEVKLVAYNGNGESDCSKRLVSLAEDGTVAKASAGKSSMNVCFVYFEMTCYITLWICVWGSVLTFINVGIQFVQERRASATVGKLRVH